MIKNEKIECIYVGQSFSDREWPDALISLLGTNLGMSRRPRAFWHEGQPILLMPNPGPNVSLLEIHCTVLDLAGLRSNNGCVCIWEGYCRAGIHYWALHIQCIEESLDSLQIHISTVGVHCFYAAGHRNHLFWLFCTDPDPTIHADGCVEWKFATK